MAKKKVTDTTEPIEDKMEVVVKEKKSKSTIDDVCPSCGKEVENAKCRLCGARKTINSVSGNVIWMRNGRIVRAFHDEKEAYVQMATLHNIPRDRWPEEFK